MQRAALIKPTNGTTTASLLNKPALAVHQKKVEDYQRDIKALEDLIVSRTKLLGAINTAIVKLDTLKTALLQAQSLLITLNKTNSANLATAVHNTIEGIQKEIKFLQDKDPEKSKAFAEAELVKIPKQIQELKAKLAALREQQSQIIQEKELAKDTKRKAVTKTDKAKRLKTSDTKKEVQLPQDGDARREPTLGLYEVDPNEPYSDGESDFDEEPNPAMDTKKLSFLPHVALFRGLTLARYDLPNKPALKRAKFAESDMLSASAKKLQEKPTSATSSSSAAAAASGLNATDAIARIQARRQSMNKDILAASTQLYVNSFTQYQESQQVAYTTKVTGDSDPNIKLFHGVLNGECEVISTSLSAREAFRFASADNVASKKIARVRQHPHYDAKGKPHHRKLGVVIATLLSQEEYKKSDLIYVRQMYAQGKINLKYSYVHGQEVIVGGGITKNKLLLAQPIGVPDFTKAYQDKYALRYGFSKKEFAEYKATFESLAADTIRRQIFEYELLQRLIKFNSEKLEKRVEKILTDQGIKRSYPDLNEGQFSETRKTFKMALDKRLTEVAKASSSSSAAAAVGSTNDPRRNIQLRKTTQKIRALMLANKQEEAAKLLKTEGTHISAHEMELAFGSGNYADEKTTQNQLIPRESYKSFKRSISAAKASYALYEQARKARKESHDDAIALSAYQSAIDAVMPSIKKMIFTKSASIFLSQQSQLKEVLNANARFAHLWCLHNIHVDPSAKIEFHKGTLDIMNVCMISLRNHYEISKILTATNSDANSNSYKLTPEIIEIYDDLAIFIMRIIGNGRNKNLCYDVQGFNLNTVIDFVRSDLMIYCDENSKVFSSIKNLISTLEDTADILNDACKPSATFNEAHLIRDFIIRAYEICLITVTKKPEWIKSKDDHIDEEDGSSLENYSISSPSALRESIVFQCNQMVLAAKSFNDAKPYFEKAHALKDIILNDRQAASTNVDTLIEIYKKIKQLNPSLPVETVITALSAKLTPVKAPAAAALSLGK